MFAISYSSHFQWEHPKHAPTTDSLIKNMIQRFFTVHVSPPLSSVATLNPEGKAETTVSGTLYKDYKKAKGKPIWEFTKC